MSYALRTRTTRALVTLAVIALTVSGFLASTAASVVPLNMDFVTENEFLSLYMDPRTAEVSVLDKRTGAIWHSNPIGRDRMETVARGTAKKALGSQLSISYFTPDDLRKTADSFNDCIEYGQFEIMSIDHGIRVEYVLGQKWKSEDYLPVMVDKDRFENLILARVSSRSDRQLLLSNYDLISLQPLLDESEDSFSEELLGAHRLVLHESLTGEAVDASQSDLFERVATQIVKYNDAVTSRSGLKRQHFEHLVESPTYVLSSSAIKWDLTDIQEIVKKAGYSPEEIQQDHRTHGLNEPVPNPEVFEIAIEYILDGDNLVVRIPTSEIVYPRTAIARDGEVVGFPLCTVSVLQYFGAADREQSGYMFVPDGSGALIYLNNGKTSASQYLRPVYGSNGSLAPIREAITVEEQVFLPVFGMKCGGQAFLAIIESGDATARIAADVAGRSDSYNKVYAQFVLIPQAQTTLKGDVSNKFSITNMKVQTRMNVYQSRMCLEDIVIRYCFLHGDDADYMGMAECYRNYLVEKGALTRLTTSGDIPLYLEVVGAATRQRPIMGVPRKVTEPLTTYEEAAKIATELIDGGVRSIRLIYSGWMAGGVEHVYPAGAKLEKALGSRRDFSEMVEHLQSMGIGVFPEVSFLNVYRNTLGDGFNSWTCSARFLNGSTATAYKYDPATMQYDLSAAYAITSPSVLGRLVDSFCTDFAQYGATGITLTHMGRQVNSDYRRDPDQLIDRQQALGIQRDQLKKLSAGLGFDVMTRGGNAYALPYVSDIIGVPINSSEYLVLDCSVPFYQIVMHGFKGYAGEPINFAQDYLTAALKTIETGGIPYFRVCWRDSSVLKDSESQYLYSLRFDDWKDVILAFYADVNEVLRDVQDQAIVDHAQLAKGIFRTKYANGVEITVDYNSKRVYR